MKIGGLERKFAELERKNKIQSQELKRVNDLLETKEEERITDVYIFYFLRFPNPYPPNPHTLTQTPHTHTHTPHTHVTPKSCRKSKVWNLSRNKINFKLGT